MSTSTPESTLAAEARRKSTPTASDPKPAFSAVQRVTNFKETTKHRQVFDTDGPIKVTKSPNPEWTFGAGVESPDIPHREIDPHGEDRTVSQNYRLLISGIAPRPIGFVSTVSKSGKKNLAPFSYFQVVDHDPPMFLLSFSSRLGSVKNTFQNLKDTGECVINTVSEDMIEAVSASSIDAPYGVPEWDITGLTEAPTTTVKPSRVKESVFSVEAKLVDLKKFGPHKDGMSAAAVCLVEASRFWVREDATNEEGSEIELEVLRPVGQLGGMMYAGVRDVFEVPRMRWADEVAGSEVLRGMEGGEDRGGSQG